MDGTTSLGNSSANLAYTDYAKLKNQFADAENTPDNIRKAAKHFESIFIDMWLKSAREANKVMAEGNFMSGAYMDMSQQMLDHEMSVHLADNGGIGLADVIVRQLSVNIAPSEAESSSELQSIQRQKTQFFAPQSAPYSATQHISTRTEHESTRSPGWQPVLPAH